MQHDGQKKGVFSSVRLANIQTFEKLQTSIPRWALSRLRRLRVMLNLLQFFYVAFFMHRLTSVIELARFHRNEPVADCAQQSSAWIGAH